MTCVARLGMVAGLCLLAGVTPTSGQPGPMDTVTCENYFEKTPPAGTPTIKMYRYGNWTANPAKWNPTKVVTERVVSDGKGGWTRVPMTSREYPIPQPPKPPGPGSGTYGLAPGQPVPNGFTVDTIPNVPGTKTYWRATLWAKDANMANPKEKGIVMSTVQELIIP